MWRIITATVLVLATAVIAWSLAVGFLSPAAELARGWPGVLFKAALVLAGGFCARYLFAAGRPAIRHRPTLSIVLAMSVSVAAFILAVQYVDARLKSRTYAGIYNDCHKIWATRGLVLEGPEISFTGSQNSIESIQLAFESGARGTEVDVLFDTGRNEFIVSHDIPYNLKNGRILALESLFENVEAEGYYWIDFKKIRKLTDQQLENSVQELERLAARFGLKQKLYVEGEAPLSLMAYRDAGFHTIFDTHPRADGNLLTPVIVSLYKLVFYYSDFSVMAMNYGPIEDPRYGPRTRNILGNIPLFIYHIEDDSAALNQLLLNPSVRVILVRDHSVNRYRLNACADPGAQRPDA